MQKQWQTILGGCKITADGDCSYEIKRRLLLGRKAMKNLNSILKGRDITLPTKVCVVKAMVSPVVTYGCESWTRKKAEYQRIDAFELWCWRRLWRVPWTARRSNQSILKEINHEYSLEELILKLKFQYFRHLMWRTDWGWDSGMASPTQWTMRINCPRSVQFSSVPQPCPTLCDPMDCSTPHFPVLHHLPELA